MVDGPQVPDDIIHEEKEDETNNANEDVITSDSEDEIDDELIDDWLNLNKQEEN